MTVYVKNLTINGGETFSEDITLFSADGTGVVDLTGFTAQSQIRKTAAHYQFADFTVGITSAAQGLVNVSVASTINAVKFNFGADNSTNIESGKFSVYGIKEYT